MYCKTCKTSVQTQTTLHSAYWILAISWNMLCLINFPLSVTLHGCMENSLRCKKLYEYYNHSHTKHKTTLHDLNTIKVNNNVSQSKPYYTWKSANWMLLISIQSTEWNAIYTAILCIWLFVGAFWSIALLSSGQGCTGLWYLPLL